MALNVARAGDLLVRVACCDAGPKLVRSSFRSTWRCGSCRSAGVDVELLVLGAPGVEHTVREPAA